jgi:hypothetical protein
VPSAAGSLTALAAGELKTSQDDVLKRIDRHIDEIRRRQRAAARAV